MTLWLQSFSQEHPYPMLIFIHEYNYFYEEYDNKIIISYNNLFSIINYINNHLNQHKKTIWDNYKKKLLENSTVEQKIVLLKNLMEPWDSKKYYFFIPRDISPYIGLINDNNYEIFMENYHYTQSNHCITTTYYDNKNNWEILPVFHHKKYIKIYFNKKDIFVNNNYYRHLINLVKLIYNSIHYNQWITSWKLLESYWGVSLYNWEEFYNKYLENIKEHCLSYQWILEKILLLWPQQSLIIHKFIECINDVNDLNHLITFNNQYYHYTSLLWKTINEPLIIESYKQPYKNSETIIGLNWSESKKNYFYLKQKFLHKHQTNYQSLIGKTMDYNGLPWSLWQSTTIYLSLEKLLTIGMGELWLYSVTSKNIILYNHNHSIYIEELQTKAHTINLSDWVIESHYNNNYLKCIIPLNGAYLTKNNDIYILIIQHKEYDLSLGHLLSFIVKKEFKNYNFHNEVYFINYNNVIIGKFYWGLSGYFFMNTVENKIHKFFEDFIEQDNKQLKNINLL